MIKRPKFILVFDPDTIDHVEAIARKHHGMIRRALNEQLSHDPGVSTRNRKPLEALVPWGATWELRFGPGNRFRAFYEIDEAERSVKILAIGVKEGNRLWVGGKEIEL